MAKDYSEDQPIQKSTAELLEQELGWKSVYAFDNEVLSEQGTLGRKTQHEVVLTCHTVNSSLMSIAAVRTYRISSMANSSKRKLDCIITGRGV